MKSPQTLLLLLALALPAFGQTTGCVVNRQGQTVCPPADTRCVANRYGDWLCSPPGGDAVVDKYGEPVCGAGACITDINSVIMCSTQARGAAAVDLYAKAVCTGGCAPATAAQCTPLTR
jgi:hypothetical protein